MAITRCRSRVRNSTCGGRQGNYRQRRCKHANTSEEVLRKVRARGVSFGARSRTRLTFVGPNSWFNRSRKARPLSIDRRGKVLTLSFAMLLERARKSGGPPPLERSAPRLRTGVRALGAAARLATGISVGASGQLGGETRRRQSDRTSPDAPDRAFFAHPLPQILKLRKGVHSPRATCGERLGELGWIDGCNCTCEYRRAEGHIGLF